MLLTISVLVSLKGRAVTVTPPSPASPPQSRVSLQRLGSSLHPDDRESRASELFCVAFRSHNLYK